MTRNAVYDKKKRKNRRRSYDEKRGKRFWTWTYVGAWGRVEEGLRRVVWRGGWWWGSYRCVAVHAADAVEIDGRQALIRQAVVKAASRTVAPFLVCVVQRHLKHTHTQKHTCISQRTHTHTCWWQRISAFLPDNGALKATWFCSQTM